jgi:hypothetical protein
MDSSSNELPRINATMFDECPVWAGEYDDGFVPVFNHDPLPEDVGNLYLKVEFVTPGGVRLAGCVSTPARHFAAVFVGRAAFYFNAAVSPLEREVQDLKRRVPELKDDIFPLIYETSYHFAGSLRLRTRLRCLGRSVAPTPQMTHRLQAPLAHVSSAGINDGLRWDGGF